MGMKDAERAGKGVKATPILTSFVWRKSKYTPHILGGDAAT